MAIIKVESKNQSGIDQKPRVYFTCHPEDFDRYFRQICDDIFATHDCGIYYTEDMAALIDEADLETDLGRNNLFVVPVTLKLLTTPNRTMAVDLPYALQEHIPVLPIMMEAELDELYAGSDLFGELQYLNPCSNDGTEISYRKKLKKYLEAVLISDELAQRVRAAFDAYIFLSYRKKDRRYANELMRLIHSIPECRDIAIWFDEFLTPGESFRESIDRILHDSKLFTLLVTPSLLEDDNFVMAEEYPAAKSSGIPILPTEMEHTDKELLGQKFPNIPLCVKPSDESFRLQLLDAVTRLATKSNNTPEHNFLIGIAYLEGIDVEVNREHALELITSAAEAELPEAMEQLHRMYKEGIGVPLNYRKALFWAEKLVQYMTAHHGQQDPDTLCAMNDLAIAYHSLGDYHKAVVWGKKVYTLYSKVMGEEDPDAITALSNLALTYSEMGDYRKALELHKKGVSLCCKVLGQEHPDTLVSLCNLSCAYSELGEYQKVAELAEKVYALSCKIHGEEHPFTLTALNNLAMNHSGLGNPEKALELHRQSYALTCKIHGEEHPETLIALNNLASAYHETGDYQTAVAYFEIAYRLRCQVLGAEHPSTLLCLCNLACSYGELGEHQKALELQEMIYRLRRRELGKKHPDTLLVLNNLAITHYQMGDYTKAMALLQEIYPLFVQVLGKTHPNTLEVRDNLETLRERSDTDQDTKQQPPHSSKAGWLQKLLGKKQ